MKNDFKSYVDDFNLITIIISKNVCFKEKKFVLNYLDKQYPLESIKIGSVDDNFKYHAKLDFDLDLHEEMIIVDEFDNESHTESGQVVRTDKFDELYATDISLGVLYDKEFTRFRLWSPVAKEIEVELTDLKNKVTTTPLFYKESGVWEATLYGDYECYRYRYKVRLGIKVLTVADPYAYSSSSNGKFNYIVDPSKFYKPNFKAPEFSGVPTDAVIYEANIRDFSINASAGAKNKGKFLGFLENHPTDNGIPTGISYLSYLGVTHVQLLPVFDFGGVDDNSDAFYNWGYNPEQYFVPCGWYSNAPDKPYERINEFIRLVDGIHANNISVVLDFVFNHVYDSDKFPFDSLVHGYFYRVDEHGKNTEVSGCQNDLATERKMTRKFIIDCLKYWVETYSVNGFRFDLMGLIDVDTMNAISSELSWLDPTIILYGEGWKMENQLEDSTRAHMYNQDKMSGIGFFNDKYRDFFKGSQWNKELGYCAGHIEDNDTLFYLITGSTVDNYLFSSPTKSINYVECHDNFTFVDFFKVNSEYSLLDIKKMSSFALAIVLFSQGVPFIHEGQEFFRSKCNVENSYKSGDAINSLDFNQRDENIENILMVRDIIKLRKTYKELRFKDQEDITNNISICDSNPLELVIKGNEYNLYLIIKNNNDDLLINLDNVSMIFNGKRASDTPCDNLKIKDMGVYLFKGEKDNE